MNKRLPAGDVGIRQLSEDVVDFIGAHRAFHIAKTGFGWRESGA